MDNKCGAGIVLAATLAVLVSAPSAVRADTLLINDQLQVRQSDVAHPARGLSMSAVESKFGAPTAKHDAVGTPPITRWDYPQFAVFFEKDRVIDAVLPPPASEPSTSPQSAAAPSAPSNSGATAAVTQEPVAPTPATAAMPSDAAIPSGAPNPPAAPPSDDAAPSAAPEAPTAPEAPAAPSAPATAPAPTLPAAQSSAPTPSATSSEDPIGIMPVSVGPSASTPAPAQGPPASTPAAPANPHP